MSWVCGHPAKEKPAMQCAMRLIAIAPINLCEEVIRKFLPIATMNDGANEEQEIDDGADLVRKTDLLIQQLAAARASSGVPTPTKTGTSTNTIHHHEGYSVPSEVTFGLPAAGANADEDESAGKNDATLSTAEVTGDADQDDDADDSSSDGEYQDAATKKKTKPQTSTSPTPTPLRAKIMKKYGREGSSSNVSSVTSGGGQPPRIPSSITSQQSKKKKNKDSKKKRKDGSTRKNRTSGSRKSTSPRSDDHEGTTTASASYSHGYGADYSPSMSSPSPVPARTSTRASPSAVPATTPQSYAGTYQGTPKESLQEAMRQAEIAEDAARRMREAVSVHQTMDRDGGGNGMPGFGSSGPGRYGPTPTPGPARVAPSMLETGATACIRELLGCLADPLAALSGDNAAPAGSTPFGGEDNPYPRWARASGSYEYVPVPNIRHVFGGGDAPADAAEGRDNGAGVAQNEGGEASSERKGLLSGTGYDSNW